MNKFCIKTKLILIALLSVIVAFCGFISIIAAPVHAEGIEGTAVAAAEDRSIDLTNAKWYINGVEFNDSQLIYDGKSKNLTLDGNDELIYEYYSADNQKLDGAPKTVGSYYVKVVAPEGVTLTGDYEERKDFVIAKATLVNPSAEFTRELDITRGKWIITPIPSTSKFYSDAVISGTLEAGTVGTYQIRLEFTLTDPNFQFDSTNLNRNLYEIFDDGNKFAITYSWTIEENVERSFSNAQNYTVIIDENNTLPEGVAETDFKVSMEEMSLDDYTDILKEQFSDKGARYGATYNIFFADSENNEIQVADGSKFLITVPVAANLTDYEKDNIKVMHIKQDGNVEFLSITDIVDESWGDDENKTTVKSIDFEATDLGMFVIIGLKQLPDSVGDWWQIALVAALAIVVVLAIVFFVMKPKKDNEFKSVKKTENDENKNE